ncbi:hypothetical protein IT568_00230 [bacterium]|nr:hypothetical protein [bacterium]
MFKEIAGELAKLKVNDKELRKFGITFFVILGLISLILFWKEKPEFLFFEGNGFKVFGGLSVLFLFLGLIAPKILTGFFKIWMGLAFTLGWIMTRVILTILFFGVFMPIGLFLRLSGKDILDEKLDKSTKSYWQIREKKMFNPKNCERLF